MPRPRAADDFKTIPTRMEELWQERLPEQPAPTTDASVAGHRGCDMRLFSDEWNRREWDTSSRSQHQLLLYLFYQVEIRSRGQCDALERDFQNRSRISQYM